MEAGFRMSAATYTPVPYWLSLPISELMDWIQVRLSMGEGK
ncbi:MAG TPA: hypothetical protein PK728_04590 [Bacillota bacterium]|nr:hypothetical protein [Bacillota bacterium]